MAEKIKRTINGKKHSFDRPRVTTKAVANATGARLRDLPLRPYRVKPALG